MLSGYCNHYQYPRKTVHVQSKSPLLYIFKKAVHTHLDTRDTWVPGRAHVAHVTGGTRLAWKSVHSAQTLETTRGMLLRYVF